MVYCETIEESKTWVCPKTGVWKIICIGGGGAGYVKGTTVKYVSSSGGATSFGNYISAGGGNTSGNFKFINQATIYSQYNYNTFFGINGFNGCTEYGSPSNTFIGAGYGAGGGVNIINNTDGAPGMPGKVISTIVDIEKGAEVSCSIGEGGDVKWTEEDTDAGTYKGAAAFPGTKGAIIVQYLGSKM